MAEPVVPGRAVPGRVVLWGSAGHAKVLAALLARCGGELIALFDRAEVTPAVDGVPLHVGRGGFEAWRAALPSVEGIAGFVAIGGDRGADRIELQTLFECHGLAPALLVHPDASVCATATLGNGTQVLAQAVVAAEARLGRACIVNHGANVDHECVLGDGVHLAPRATLCGCVQAGDGAFVGAGAVVLPRLRLGAHCIVGAGAVVTHDVPAGAVVVGHPARVIRHR